MEPQVGYLAEITKKQSNRKYFSDLPIGTKFIITKILNWENYDLHGYFLNVMPQNLKSGPYFFGYINRGTWKVIGPLAENIDKINKRY
jgi:hypothetical protein